MNTVALACALCVFAASSRAATLAERIGHYVPEKAQHITAVHEGAGSLNVATLLDDTSLSTNLLFWHRGVIAPHSGIGEHCHNYCEEMFIILAGEAEFTIDGRTTLLQGLAAPRAVSATPRHHQSHRPTSAIDEHQCQPAPNVYDAFDLDDGRVGAPKDAIAQFITMKLDRSA